MFTIKEIGVLRWSPRALTTNQPTNRALIKRAGPISALETIFWGKNGRFGAKNPNFYRRKQKFWYPNNGKPPKQNLAVFGRKQKF